MNFSVLSIFMAQKSKTLNSALYYNWIRRIRVEIKEKQTLFCEEKNCCTSITRSREHISRGCTGYS